MLYGMGIEIIGIRDSLSEIPLDEQGNVPLENAYFETH
jgi:hypothetical protein